MGRSHSRTWVDDGGVVDSRVSRSSNRVGDGPGPQPRLALDGHRNRFRIRNPRVEQQYLPLDVPTRILAKNIFKLFQSVHHKSIIDNAIQTQSPPKGMLKQVNKLTSFIRPSSPNPEVHRAVAQNTQNWLTENLLILQRHYSDLLYQYRYLHYEEVAFEAALGWAKKRYRGRFNPSTPVAVKNLLLQCDEPSHVSASPLSSANDPSLNDPVQFPSLSDVQGLVRVDSRAPARRSPVYSRSLDLGHRSPLVDYVIQTQSSVGEPLSSVDVRDSSVSVAPHIPHSGSTIPPLLAFPPPAVSPTFTLSPSPLPLFHPSFSQVAGPSRLTAPLSGDPAPPLSPPSSSFCQQVFRSSSSPVHRDTSPKLLTRSDLIVNQFIRTDRNTHLSNVGVLQSIAEVSIENDQSQTDARVSSVLSTDHASVPALTQGTGLHGSRVSARRGETVVMGAMMTREPIRPKPAVLSGALNYHPEPSSLPPGSDSRAASSPVPCAALVSHEVRVPRVHKARQSRKISDWNFRCDRPIYILGDSNLARVGSFQNDAIEIDSFPGASFYHFQEVMSKAEVHPGVKVVVLSVGLLNREQDPYKTSIKQLRRIYNSATDKFPNAQVYVAQINFSKRLPWEQVNTLNIINNFISSHYPYLRSLPPAQVETARDLLHWTRSTAQAILRSWCTQLHLEINLN